MVVKKSKSVIGILLISLLLLGFNGCTTSKEADSQNSDNRSKVYAVGVIQIEEHPALDSAREGFLQALEDHDYVQGENIDIEYLNAQGDINTANTIAKGFVSGKKDMIFAIATPTAQAAYNATKDIPILITAVTDPVSAGLVKDMANSGNNVTGTSDMTPIEQQLDLMLQLIPDVKSVGVVYNTGEANSEIQVNMVKELLDSKGINLMTKGVTNINEVSQALDALADDIDVLYVPTDNMVVASMPLISSKYNKLGIPVIGSEEGQVENGALATEGISYYELGYQTGKMAIKVIEGTDPTDIPLETLEKTELVINKKTAEILNIGISEELLNDAKVIE